MSDHNLFQASAQWANRPADERFWDIPEFMDAAKYYHANTRRSTVTYGDLEISSSAPDTANPHGEVLIRNRTKPNYARMTHFAFGQLCQRAAITKDDVTVTAPAGYLRNLPAPLAVDCLRHGLNARDPHDIAQIQIHANGGMLVKSITTDSFEPLWNHEVISGIEKLAGNGWRVPPARPAPKTDKSTIRIASSADCLDMESIGGMVIKPGDAIAPSGLYASDHDMFAFVINPNREIESGLFRGAFFWNSEVGNKSFGGCLFYFRSVCGNHIVWDVSNLTTFRSRHVGDIRQRANALINRVIDESDKSTEGDRQRLQSARNFKLGADKPAVLETVFKMRINGLSKSRTEQAYDIAVEYAEREPSAPGMHGLAYDPHSAYGYAQGLTRLSQSVGYADTRSALDNAAGEILLKSFPKQLQAVPA